MRILVRLSFAGLVLFLPLSAPAQLDVPVIRPAPPAIEPLRTEDPDGVAIEKTLYFLDPDGRYVIVPAGLYLVRRREDSSLVLVPHQGRQAMVVHAQTTTHQDSLTEPIALAVTDQQTDLHIILLEPGGKGLDAMGALTPVRLRSAEVPTLSADLLRQALVKKASAAQVPK